MFSSCPRRQGIKGNMCHNHFLQSDLQPMKGQFNVHKSLYSNLVRARIEQFRLTPWFRTMRNELAYEAASTWHVAPKSTNQVSRLHLLLSRCAAHRLGYTRPHTLSDRSSSLARFRCRPQVGAQIGSNEAFDCRFPALKPVQERIIITDPCEGLPPAVLRCPSVLTLLPSLLADRLRWRLSFFPFPSSLPFPPLYACPSHCLDPRCACHHLFLFHHSWISL